MPLPHNRLVQQALAAYPAVYEKVISDWQQDGPDALWLVYAANYLFRVGGARWAVDPLTLPARVSGALPIHLRQDFAKLDFLILTHKHSDHLNWSFLKCLAALPAQWIVPEFLIEDCLAQTGVSPNNIIPALAGQWIDMNGVRVLPMPGSHWEYAQTGEASSLPVKGVPSLCYLFEFHDQRWFFPGDVRALDAANIPQLGALDGVVGHVWMGRMRSPQEAPPLFEQFCDYFSSFPTNRLILTHLYEMGRDMKDMWTLAHAHSVISALYGRAPAVRVEALRTGERLLFRQGNGPE